jgi:dUTP pyrophosphatase
MQVNVKRFRDNATLPTYAHPGDVGMDVYAVEDYTLNPGERRVFDVGFGMEFEQGYAAIIKDKSSLPNKHGIHTMGGVYDAGYRGEYNVQLINLGSTAVEIAEGQKIAQIVIFPVAIATLTEVDELSDSVRGDGKFGSTGKF